MGREEGRKQTNNQPKQTTHLTTSPSPPPFSYWVNMIDIAPDNAEQVLAFSNTLGTFPGIIGNVVTGAILTTTGSWSGVFGGL